MVHSSWKKEGLRDAFEEYFLLGKLNFAQQRWAGFLCDGNPWEVKLPPHWVCVRAQVLTPHSVFASWPGVTHPSSPGPAHGSLAGG